MNLESGKGSKSSRWPMVLALAVLALAAGLWWLPDMEPLRSWRIHQEKPLVDGISMKIENLYLRQHRSGIYLIDIRSRWIGGDPSVKYTLRATLHTRPEGPPIQIAYWRIANFNGSFLWQFSVKAPPTAKRLYLRVYYKPSEPGGQEKSLQFEMPNLPKVVPSGSSSPQSD